jgi:glycerol-3-phosphate acyltransferase PlsY
LLLDALKGAGPVLLTGWLLPLPTWPLGAVALAAVVGHCFPVWLRFRGGKGVATALGVFVVLEPLAALGSVVVFAAVYAALRIASVGSLVASMAFVPIAWWLGSPRSVVMLALVIVLLIVVQHRDNLKRLRRGREHRL